VAPKDITAPDSGPRKFVIGLDYGTTFTSVSYSIHPLDEEHLRAFPWEIKSISNWPQANTPVLAAAEQVPTETWYSPIPVDRKLRNPFSPSENARKGRGAAPGSRVKMSVVRVGPSIL